MPEFKCYFLAVESGVGYERHFILSPSKLGGETALVRWWHGEGKPPGLIRIVAPDGQVSCKAMGGLIPWSEVRKVKKKRYPRWHKK